MGDGKCGKCDTCGGWYVPERFWDQPATNSGECPGHINDLNGYCGVFTPAEINRLFEHLASLGKATTPKE
jgi:hypothetical protein